PLGAERLAETRVGFGWPEEKFHVPAEVADRCAELCLQGREAHEAWLQLRSEWAVAHPELAAWWDGETGAPADLADRMPVFEPGTSMATRKASGAVIQALAPSFPALVGGSADLAGSTNTAIPDTTAVTAGDYSGRTLHFGIREHG